MRFIFGVIVGVALTVGFAYVHDSVAPGTGEAAAKPYVNWETVGTSMRSAAATVREQWDKLTSK